MQACRIRVPVCLQAVEKQGVASPGFDRCALLRTRRQRAFSLLRRPVAWDRLANGEASLTALLHIREVHQDCSNALSSVNNIELIVEIVIMRLVFLTSFIVQNLNSLTVIYGNHGEGGNSLLYFLRELIFASWQEHSVACAYLAIHTPSGFAVDDRGLHHVRRAQVDHLQAFLLAQEVVRDKGTGLPGYRLDPHLFVPFLENVVTA
mmetsp:Transcript_23052/g.50545  ORF Transcript_23052/g.50545 Transcript_23052/m.50545 type:complete len:206 (-) Transcript_23052:257-874(-)